MINRTELAKKYLKKYPQAKKIAVQNFVGTLVGKNIEDELANVGLDARLYKWNEDTVRAIQDAIIDYYSSLN